MGQDGGKLVIRNAVLSFPISALEFPDGLYDIFKIGIMLLIEVINDDGKQVDVFIDRRPGTRFSLSGLLPFTRPCPRNEACPVGTV